MNILFYTPSGQKDYLSHAIIWATHGTFSHCSIHRKVGSSSEVIEAIPPAIHKLTGMKAITAFNYNQGIYVVSGPNQEEAWSWLETQIGHGYSWGTILTDAIANLFGIRSIVKWPGTYVCSSIAAMFLFLAKDPSMQGIISIDELYGYTPADLAQKLLGKRVHK